MESLFIFIKNLVDIFTKDARISYSSFIFFSKENWGIIDLSQFDTSTGMEY